MLDFNQELQQAVIAGKEITAIEELIKKGASLNIIQVNTGFNLLHLAIQYNHLHIVTWLLSCPNFPLAALTALTLAEQNIFHLAAQIQFKVEEKEKIIAVLCDKLAPDLKAKLLAQFDVNGKLPVYYALVDGAPQLTELFLKNGQITTAIVDEGYKSHPLHIAAFYNHTQLIVPLLEHQALIEVKNENNETPYELGLLRNPHWALALLQAQLSLKKLVTLYQKDLKQLPNWDKDLAPKLFNTETFFLQQDYKQAKELCETLTKIAEAQGVIALQVICWTWQGSILLKEQQYYRALLSYKTAQVLFGQLGDVGDAAHEKQFDQYNKLVEACFMQEVCKKSYQNHAYDFNFLYAELINRKALVKEFFSDLKFLHDKNSEQSNSECSTKEIKEKNLFPISLCHKGIIKVLKDLTSYSKKIFQKILQDVEQELGTAPCAYGVALLGSASRDLITLCSDLEWVIFIDPSHSLKKNKQLPLSTEIHDYFLHFTQFVHLKLLQLGETPYPCQRESNDIHLKKIITIYRYFLSVLPQGFRLDEDLLNPFALYLYELPCQDVSKMLFGTPQELLDKLQNKETRESDLNRYYAMQAVVFVYGTKTLGELLVTEYQTKLKKHLDAKNPQTQQTLRQEQALTLLKINLEEFNFAKAGGNDLTQLSFNVKKELYRAIAMIVQHLGCYYGIDNPNPWEIIKALEEKQLLHPINAKYLSSALCMIMTLRLKAQLHYSTEYEMLWSEEANYVPPPLQCYRPPLLLDQELLDGLTQVYKILLPLHWQAKKWLDNPTKKYFATPIVLNDPIQVCLAQGMLYQKLGQQGQSELCYYAAKILHSNVIKMGKAPLSVYVELTNTCYFLVCQLRKSIQQQREALNFWIDFLCQRLVSASTSAENYIPYYVSLVKETQQQFISCLKKMEKNNSLISYILGNLADNKDSDNWLSHRHTWEKLLNNEDKEWQKRLNNIKEKYDSYKEAGEFKEEQRNKLLQLLELLLQCQGYAPPRTALPPLFIVHYFEIAIQKKQKELLEIEDEKKNITKELLNKIISQKKFANHNDYLPLYKELMPEMRQQLRQELIVMQHQNVEEVEEQKNKIFKEELKKESKEKLKEESKKFTLPNEELEKIIFTLNNYPDELGERPQLVKEKQQWQQELSQLVLAPTEHKKAYETGKEIYLISNIIGGMKLLKPEIAKLLLNEDFTFKEHKINHSIHDVIRLKLTNSVIYVKKEPNMPGMTYFIGEIYRRLIGHGVPYSELAKIQCGKKSIVVELKQGVEQEFNQEIEKEQKLNQEIEEKQEFNQKIEEIKKIEKIKLKESEEQELKQEIEIKLKQDTEQKLNQEIEEKQNEKNKQEKINQENTTLFDILQKNPEKLKHLSLPHYQELTLLALIICPGDDREPNWILKKLNNKLYTLINIDYEEALYPEWIEDPNNKGVLKARVSSILYCLKQINEPIGNEVKQKINAINPLQFMRKLLQDAQHQNQIYATIFSQNELSLLDKKNKSSAPLIPIPIKPGDATMLYHRLCRLQAFLKNPKNTEATTLDCFKHLSPALGNYYAKLLQDKKLTPSQHLQKAMNLKVDFNTGMTVSALNKTLVLNGSVYLGDNLYKLDKINPATGLSELDFIIYQEQLLDKIREEVQQGKFARFTQLVSPEHKRIVICGDKKHPGIIFGADGLEKVSAQSELLNLCTGVSFKKLRLKNCQALSPQILQKLLMKSQDLQLLEIDNCTPFASEYFKLIADKCKALRYLKISNLPQNIQELIELSFENLITLEINNIPSLLAITDFKLSQATKIEIKNCAKLKSISLQEKANNFLQEKTNNLTTSILTDTALLVQDCPEVIKIEVNSMGVINKKLRKFNVINCQKLIKHLHKQGELAHKNKKYKKALLFFDELLYLDEKNEKDEKDEKNAEIWYSKGMVYRDMHEDEKTNKIADKMTDGIADEMTDEMVLVAYKKAFDLDHDLVVSRLLRELIKAYEIFYVRNNAGNVLKELIKANTKALTQEQLKEIIGAFCEILWEAHNIAIVTMAQENLVAIAGIFISDKESGKESFWMMFGKLFELLKDEKESPTLRFNVGNTLKKIIEKFHKIIATEQLNKIIDVFCERLEEGDNNEENAITKMAQKNLVAIAGVFVSDKENGKENLEMMLGKLFELLKNKKTNSTLRYNVGHILKKIIEKFYKIIAQEQLKKIIGAFCGRLEEENNKENAIAKMAQENLVAIVGIFVSDKESGKENFRMMLEQLLELLEDDTVNPTLRSNVGNTLKEIMKKFYKIIEREQLKKIIDAFCEILWETYNIAIVTMAQKNLVAIAGIFVSDKDGDKENLGIILSKLFEILKNEKANIAFRSNVGNTLKEIIEKFHKIVAQEQPKNIIRAFCERLGEENAQENLIEIAYIFVFDKENVKKNLKIPRKTDKLTNTITIDFDGLLTNVQNKIKELALRLDIAEELLGEKVLKPLLSKDNFEQDFRHQKEFLKKLQTQYKELLATFYDEKQQIFLISDMETLKSKMQYFELQQQTLEEKILSESTEEVQIEEKIHEQPETKPKEEINETQVLTKPKNSNPNFFGQIMNIYSNTKVQYASILNYIKLLQESMNRECRIQNIDKMIEALKNIKNIILSDDIIISQFANLIPLQEMNKFNEKILALQIIKKNLECDDALKNNNSPLKVGIFTRGKFDKNTQIKNKNEQIKKDLKILKHRILKKIAKICCENSNKNMQEQKSLLMHSLIEQLNKESEYSDTDVSSNDNCNCENNSVNSVINDGILNFELSEFKQKLDNNNQKIKYYSQQMSQVIWNIKSTINIVEKNLSKKTSLKTSNDLQNYVAKKIVEQINNLKNKDSKYEEDSELNELKQEINEMKENVETLNHSYNVLFGGTSFLISIASQPALASIQNNQSTSNQNQSLGLIEKPLPTATPIQQNFSDTKNTNTFFKNATNDLNLNQEGNIQDNKNNLNLNELLPNKNFNNAQNINNSNNKNSSDISSKNSNVSNVALNNQVTLFPFQKSLGKMQTLLQRKIKITNNELQSSDNDFLPSAIRRKKL